MSVDTCTEFATNSVVILVVIDVDECEVKYISTGEKYIVVLKLLIPFYIIEWDE